VISTALAACRRMASVRIQRLPILSKKKSVFVIDDDPSMRISIKRLLRAHGLGVLLFESVDALIGHGDFDNAICLVIDINLGGQSGIDLRRHLTEEGSPHQ
jgi:FixJ family two-component response regulator